MLEHTRPVRICVIDDVEPVVIGVCTRIDWDSYGIEVAGSAFNGEDGLELVLQEKPDIILTDIRMPVMSGLDLATVAMKHVPLAKVILLSGYTDFEYAQQALRIGAFDFIAKPFSLEEIVNVVLKAKEELERERHRFRNEEALRKQVKDSMPLLRQEYWNLLLHHGATEEQALAQWEFLGIDLEREPFAVMAVEVDQFADRFKELSVQEIELVRFSLQNILEETMLACTKGVFVKESSRRFVCVMNPPADRDMRELAETCREHVEQFTKFTVSIGLGEKVKRLSEVRHSYRQALQALTYHFYTGGNGVMSYSDLQFGANSRPVYQINSEHGLFFALRTGNSAQALAMLAEIEADLARLRPLPRPEYSIGLYSEIAYMLLRVLQEKVDYDKVKTLEDKVQALKTQPVSTLGDLQSLLRTICTEGCALIEQGRISESEQLVDTTRKYIKSNLQRDLTVAHCAQIVHLSASYFANVFKKVTGVTFSHYVTAARMDKAKEMLLDGYQVQEIAPLVGYEDRRYFSDAFKKVTGMTPSEYKRSCTGSAEEY